MATGSRAALVPLRTPIPALSARGSLLRMHPPPHQERWAADGVSDLQHHEGTTPYYRGLNSPFTISLLPRETKAWRNYPSPFPPVIFAAGWEWDFDPRNNKCNNGECVTIDLPLAEEAGSRCSGKEGQTIRRVLMDGFFPSVAPRLPQAP